MQALSKDKSPYIRIAAALFLALCLSSFLFLFRSLRFLDADIYASSGSISSYIAAALRAELTQDHGRRLFFFSVVVAVPVFYFFIRNINVVSAFLFRYRYIFAGLVLILGVLLGISGSSIGMWAKSLPFGSDTGLLLGVPRDSRTDEYALFTGMSFAQYYDPQGPWPYFGHVLRGATTDMFMVYGQPVADPSIVFRPFQIGYLFLGLERGLSFFWCGRIVALFMASFEFGRLLTGDRRFLSLGFAALVSFAPVVSWWFSINCFVEMLIFLEVTILAFDKYFELNTRVGRTGIIIVIGYSLCCFALTLYPAWEIPLAYVLISLVVGFLIPRRDIFIKRVKEDKAIILLSILVAALAMIAVALHSSQAISSVVNTDYPGQRLNLGGGDALLAFRYPLSAFLPYVPCNSLSNLVSTSPDNLTSFFDFFPLGLILCFINYKFCRKIDFVSASLIVVILFLGLYCAIGFPVLLAKITLMGKSIPQRCFVVFSFANLILLFRELSKIQHSSNHFLFFVLPCLFASLLISYLCSLNERAFLSPMRLFVIFLLLFLAWFLIFSGHVNYFCGLCIAIAFVSGATVNPVQKGIDVVDSNPLIMEMRTIEADNSSAKWVAAVGWKSNLALFAGVPTINTTNVYPNEDLWRVLDPHGLHKKIWNRYSHLNCSIVNHSRDKKFKLKQVDVIDLSLSPSDLKKLDVKFVLSDTDLLSEGIDGLRLVSKIDSYRIYEIN